MKKEEAKDMTLEMHRKKIDSLDLIVIKVLGERERIVKEIGIYKAKKNIPALQASRFKLVLERAIQAGKKEGLSEEFITTFMNALHKESLRIEEDILFK